MDGWLGYGKKSKHSLISDTEYGIIRSTGKDQTFIITRCGGSNDDWNWLMMMETCTGHPRVEQIRKLYYDRRNCVTVYIVKQPLQVVKIGDDS